MQLIVWLIAIAHLLGGVVQGLIFVVFFPEKRQMGVNYMAVGVGVFVFLNVVSIRLWGTPIF